MKIRKIKILLALSLGAMIAFSSCTKDDGAIPERVSITAVPTITTNIDPTGSMSINLLNLASFAGKFKVDNYFPGAALPSKVDIVVRKNGSNANVKLYKAGVTTLPASFTVTAAEIVALFGTPIVLGDKYDFAPDFYVGDRKFEAFPAIGNGTGAGLNGQPFFSEFARYEALCAYDPEIYKGNFVVTNDAWADFSVGDVVAFTQVSSTSFSFIDPFVLNPIPVVVTINTGTNAATITKQKIGSSWGPTYSANPATYPNPWLSGTGSVAPCSKTITLTMTYGYRFAGVPSAEATFSGTYALSLVKQ
ncbi:MAG TPA: hypothetical protein VK492_17210 [Chitinophagaceae bacterium]|nr:hypothetical protein [Chitinophagaceae bacterium]